MFPITPENIQVAGATVMMLIQMGKLVAAEVGPVLKAIFGKADPTKTDEELNAIVTDTMARAEFRELLSAQEAGQQV